MKHRLSTVAIAMFASILLPVSRVVSAQDVAAERPLNEGRASNDRSTTEILARLVSVDVDAVSLKHAIDVVSRNADVRISYDRSLLETYTAPVTMHVTKTTLGGVFDRLLAGTDLMVAGMPGNQLAVVRDKQHARGTVQSVVTGRVTDAKTRRALPGASVTLDDSIRAVRTNDAGQYRIPGVPAGAHRITVRAVGFARQTRIITVTDDSTAVADFALSSSVNTLDQVVVTATGAQRYRELGHVVTQLNADSLVRSAPITTVAQLLQSRVPGLQVMSGSGGLAGGEVALQIRGQSTLNLDPQPIVILDGVRYKNTNAIVNNSNSASVTEDTRPFGAAQRSPLNDLNVNDIESVEVVKGPSASTLYGPDAASGVIVITTKRGQVGKPKWNFYLHPNLATVTHEGGRPLVGYWGWGHDPNSGELYGGTCTLAAQYYGQCVLDSITTRPTAEGLPSLAVVARQRPQWQSGASVSGGVDLFRYFFSGGYDSQFGSLQISPSAAKILTDRLGKEALADNIKDPNTQQTLTLRSNLTTDLNPMTSLQLSMGYTRAVQRQINLSAFTNTLTHGPVQPGCTGLEPQSPCATDLSPTFIRSTGLNSNRVSGTLEGTVRPTSWLTAHGSLGMDLLGTIDRAIQPRGSLSSNDQGQAQENRRNNTDRTGRFMATARAHPGRLSFQSTLGTDYHYIQLDGLNLTGRNLAPGSTSIATASQYTTAQLWQETVSLGSFGEEIVGLNDRLFLDGSVRYDGSTSFGDAYHARPFPKLGLSWIASDEPFMKHVPGLDMLRFRSSYGASSRYPTSQMKLGQISASQYVINGSNLNAYQRGLLANPVLRPERTNETEYGADATLLSGKVDLGLTWHRRRVRDMLQLQANPQGLPSEWANVGDLAEHGWEATLTARLVDARMVQASVQFSGSFNTSKLLSLGTGFTGGACGYACFQIGHPLGSIIDRPVIGVADTAGGGQDSIAVYDEIVYGPYQFLGVTTPTHTYTMTPSVSLWSGRVRLSTLVDRATGFIVPNVTSGYGLNTDALLKSTPLILQALTQVSCCSYSPGDYTAWRELSLSTDVPSRWVHFALLSRGTVSFYVRNLALWTRDKAGDPQSLPNQGTAGTSTIGAWAGIAQPRSWSISFDFTP